MGMGICFLNHGPMLLAQHIHPFHPPNGGRWLSGHSLSMPSPHALSKDGQVARQGTQLTWLPKLLEMSVCQGQAASAWQRAQGHRRCSTYFCRMVRAARPEPGRSMSALLEDPFFWEMVSVTRFGQPIGWEH